MHAYTPSEADRDSRRAAQVLGLALPSDTVLYLLLPMFHAAFGVSLAEAGILLAANRLVRIVGYGQVARLYETWGDRPACIAAGLAATVSALAVATLSGFWLLLGARIAWGLAFAAMNLSTQALSTAHPDGAARRTGVSRAWIAAGPTLWLPLGAVLAMTIGPRPVFLLLAVCALAAAWHARGLPARRPPAVAAGAGPAGAAAPPPIPAVPRRALLRWPGRLDRWSFIEGLVLDGLFIIGLSVLGAQAWPAHAALAAGVLLALRYLSEILLSPLGGRAAQTWGAERMLVSLSLLTAVALVAFGAGWLWGGAFLIVVLRALQLPLVAPIVARRHPGPERVRALANRAVWRDIGAGLGPMLAGVLLPVASPAWIYGLAGLALAMAGWACRR